MTTEEFYQAIGGNYQDVLRRLMTEERVLRFVKKFPADDSFSLLKASLEIGAQGEAFRAAHTLKGVAQNLGFTALYGKTVVVTDILRTGSMEVAEHMPELERLYNLTVENVEKLD